jgi:lipopolysaccharide/colanic/teichoic acid biosynthesis glycosyltransferase
MIFRFAGDIPAPKRLLDLLTLAILAPVVLPAGALIALAVFLDSPGPVVFRAARVGMGGRRFEMLKFRTMKVHSGGRSLAGAGDLRITPIGRVLRRSRLDELPQLWNVLKGQMSFVGPRPELEEFVALHAADYERILAVAPGITGPTQLRYAGVEAHLLGMQEDPEGYYREQLLPSKVALDLAYATDRSLRHDVTLLCQTLALPVVLALQGRTGAGRRSVAYAGAAMAVALVPLLFAIGLGSPR